ncbi:MAG: hypothetical protein MUP98_12475, partial [Candidatus Aminicenantes bacterium]|nr:hypothetical protein [Candidatus Aminicenantes bacterium]
MKLASKFSVFTFLIFSIFYFSPAATIQTEDTHFNPADIKLKNGEAAVWYLYHSGWAVKTSSSLLIFDYWELFERTEGP